MGSLINRDIKFIGLHLLLISEFPKSGITNAYFWGYSIKMHTINFKYLIWRVRSFQRLGDSIPSLFQELPHLFFIIINATITSMLVSDKSVSIDKYMFRP